MNSYKALKAKKQDWKYGSVEYAFNLAHRYFKNKEDIEDSKKIQQFGEKIFDTLNNRDINGVRQRYNVPDKFEKEFVLAEKTGTI